MADKQDLKLYERIRAFRIKHKLTRARMAEAFGTSVRTVDAWKENTPPACAVRLVDLLERYPCIRKLAGATPEKRGRGRPFEPGHQFRFGDPRRPQAIAEAHMHRDAA